MDKNRRKGLPPIPDNARDYLTPQQLKALRDMKPLGVTLFAIRRPLFQEPTVIVRLITRDKYGVMLKNGKIDYLADITIRREVKVVDINSDTRRSRVSSSRQDQDQFRDLA